MSVFAGDRIAAVALLQGSKAIDQAGSSAPSHDQRGVKRDKHADIGAFERT
jgi:hypothetical protein